MVGDYYPSTFLSFIIMDYCVMIHIHWSTKTCQPLSCLVSFPSFSCLRNHINTNLICFLNRTVASSACPWLLKWIRGQNSSHPVVRHGNHCVWNVGPGQLGWATPVRSGERVKNIVITTLRFSIGIACHTCSMHASRSWLCKTSALKIYAWTVVRLTALLTIYSPGWQKRYLFCYSDLLV